MTFQEFKQSVESELKPLREILSQEIPAQAGAASYAARQVDKYLARLTEIEAQSETFVSDIKMIFLVENPRQEIEKDIERRAAIEKATAEARELQSRIKGLIKAVEQRVSFTQSLIKSQVLEYRAEGRLSSQNYP